MKFFLLLLGLFTAGFFMQRDRKKQVDRQTPRVSQTSSMVFCSPAFDPYKISAGEAPIFKGLGNLKYPVSTSSVKAQKYFNQGLTLLYAFNHGEAGRSFKAAIQLDSTFAMAYWGMAMVLGPNYNAALNPASLNDINAYINKALRYVRKTKPNEQALIQAIRKRFPEGTEASDMTRFNAAYANAMREAAKVFPDDVEIATLYAEALMNEHPWNLWLKDGTPQPWTPQIISQIESTLKKYPDHPGAIHYYLHAMEASREASKAVPAADKLRELLPAAGHLVHMPAHIYIRTGEYHKGVLTTERARLADSNYITQCKVQGTYPLLYYPHNTHFLAACAFLEGNSKKAIEAARSVSANADRKYINELGTVQHYFNIPYYVLVHLAKWDDILRMTDPGAGLRYPQAIWHYARGEAQLAKGNFKEAEKELILLKEIGKDESLKNLLIWETNSAADLVNIAVLVLEGELMAFKKDYDASLVLLKKAVEIEDKLTYQEPPDWFFSTRHTLGYILIKAGKHEEAETIYKQDLSILPENGWALMGFFNSLKGQDKLEEAASVKKRFDEAWKWSDFNITNSRIY